MTKRDGKEGEEDRGTGRITKTSEHSLKGLMHPLLLRYPFNKEQNCSLQIRIPGPVVVVFSRTSGSRGTHKKRFAYAFTHRLVLCLFLPLLILLAHTFHAGKCWMLLLLDQKRNSSSPSLLVVRASRNSLTGFYFPLSTSVGSDPAEHMIDRRKRKRIVLLKTRTSCSHPLIRLLTLASARHITASSCTTRRSSHQNPELDPSCFHS